jgi:DHA2 family multidrug resistance protein-like MFS transporter
VIVALGLSPMIAICTDLVISTAPPQRAGAASALSETSGELGVALGVAVLGSFGMAAYRDSLSENLPDALPAEASDAAKNTIAGALRIAEDLPGGLGPVLSEAARTAFAHGLALSAAAATVIVVAAAVLSAVRLRDLPASADSAPQPDADGNASAQPATVSADGYGHGPGTGEGERS